MGDARRRWLGHVERKTQEDVVMRTWKMEGVVPVIEVESCDLRSTGKHMTEDVKN